MQDSVHLWDCEAGVAAPVVGQDASSEGAEERTVVSSPFHEDAGPVVASLHPLGLPSDSEVDTSHNPADLCTPGNLVNPGEVVPCSCHPGVGIVRLADNVPRGTFYLTYHLAP